MMEMLRNWQIGQMENAIKTAAFIVQVTDPDALTRYRDGGDGWTVLEVLCHLRDFEALFLERAQLTLQQELPALPFPDPDQLAAEKRYNEQDVATVLDEWRKNREAYLALWRGLDEGDWARQGQHPTRGPFSLDQQLFLAAWHDVLHLEQMTRILAEKQGA